MLDHSCQVQRHPLSERGLDCYQTPAVAVEALLKVEDIPECIWEPACGPGAIVNVLRAAGHTVMATDVAHYEGMQPFSDRDFLTQERVPWGIEAIVTNPPFMLANEFVAHAIKLCPKVYMLLRLAFMESERRSPILDGGKLARVHVFRKRLPMMHREGWEGKRIGNSGMAFAWFCFDWAHKGPTELHRLSWDR